MFLQQTKIGWGFFNQEEQISSEMNILIGIQIFAFSNLTLNTMMISLIDRQRFKPKLMYGLIIRPIFVCSFILIHFRKCIPSLSNQKNMFWKYYITGLNMRHIMLSLICLPLRSELYKVLNELFVMYFLWLFLMCLH